MILSIQSNFLDTRGESLPHKVVTRLRRRYAACGAVALKAQRAKHKCVASSEGLDFAMQRLGVSIGNCMWRTMVLHQNKNKIGRRDHKFVKLLALVM